MMNKTFIVSILSLFYMGISFGQSNEEIASVYIKKAETNFKASEIEEAQKNFEKAVKLLDTIKNEGVDRLGTMIHFKLGNLERARLHAKHYFKIAADHSSDQYLEQLDLFVEIEEQLDSIKKVNEAKELARIARMKELARIDSLKIIWKNNSNNMSLAIEEIQSFDNNGIAVYKKNNHYGIMNDSGKEIIKADYYKAAKAFDGYILLLDNSMEPTKILCFISATKESFLIPEVAVFNDLSTNYGRVMIPRGNHKLIAYPNNSVQTMVYNLKTRNFEAILDTKPLFKELKKADKIDSYNKEGQVKINKVWYNFGGEVGTGVYSLYTPTYELYGFLFHIDGAIVTSEYDYLGGIYKNRIYAIKSNKPIWIDQNRKPNNAPENEAGTYTGNTKIVALDNGNFQFQKEENGKTIIFLQDTSMDLLDEFLRKNNVAETDIK